MNERAKIALTSFFLFCSALMLTAYSAKNRETSRLGSRVVTELLAPFYKLNSSVYSSFHGVWSNYLALVNVRADNKAYQKRLVAVEAENARLLELQSENERLRGLIGISKQHGLEGVGARVVGFDASSWVQAVVVDKGRADGVSTGMSVVEGRGIVGQVVAVGRNSSRVLLITDHASGVDALVQATRARGVIEGSGGTRCEWRFVFRDESVKIGDRVVTSGMGGVFPKGLAIGIVSNIGRRSDGLFHRIEVKPAVDLARLEEVFIVKVARASEPGSLEGSDGEDGQSEGGKLTNEES